MPVAHSIHAPSPAAATVMRAVIVCSLATAYLPVGHIDRASASGVDHLVVSEVMTGGTSASDELIELYNPFPGPLPLEGLEVVYVTASGATVSRRASWGLGAPAIPPGGHLLIANELGIFAPIADALYASGMAATGGSVALRIQGASSAIDAVGWGTATNTWLEGIPAAAPPSGASLERLPGGPAGSTVDTNANHTDFTVRPVPDPQNTGSQPVPDPIQPTPTPTDIPDPTPAPTPDPTVTPAPTESSGPTATPAPMPISIAAARALADGTIVTVEGDTLTASDFTDGGGYLADPSGAVAVLLDAGSFARGQRLLVRGVVDDRFAQRTIRAAAGDISVTGTGIEPEPVQTTTGTVNESIEAHLVRITGTIAGSPTALSGGLAFDVDDGSGATRVVVATASGIDTSGWSNGVAVRVTGVVGQRDSSGTGSSGYRVQPRGPEDVERLPAASPTPSPGGSPSLEPTPSPSTAAAAVVPIARARAAAKNARVTIRGVVTLASGTVEPGSAVMQDGTGAILLRLGEEAGSVARGQLLEVAGVRSTKSGMESLRVSVRPRRLGTAPDPMARVLRTGGAMEAAEAQLVVVRGAIVTAARKASTGTVSFELDDGSGRLRVVIGARLGADRRRYTAGTWMEVRGVLGQQTVGAQPLRGYRVWPRTASDLRVLAGATGKSTSGDSSRAGDIDGGGSAATGSLAAVGTADLAGLRVGATLVSASWPELGVAGLLWDGARLVGIAPASADRVERVIDGRAVPLSLELAGLRELGQTARAGLGLVSLGDAGGDTVLGAAPPAFPSARMPGRGDPPAWVSLIGRVTVDHGSPAVEIAGTRVAILRLCNRGRLPDGTASLLGVATAHPPRIIVGCDGSRPAPTLSLVASRQDGGTGIRPGTHAAPADSAAGLVPRHRLLAAVLLASGVAILGLGVMLGRRVGTRDPDTAGEDAGGEAATALGPQLTLVGLPNEHGP